MTDILQWLCFPKRTKCIKFVHVKYGREAEKPTPNKNTFDSYVGKETVTLSLVPIVLIGSI